MLLEKVRTMSNPFSEEDVIGIIKNKDKNIDIRQVEKLYYPYMWLVFRAKTGKNKKNPLGVRKIMGFDGGIFITESVIWGIVIAAILVLIAVWLSKDFISHLTVNHRMLLF